MKGYILCRFLDALLIGVLSDVRDHSTACNLTESEIDVMMQQYNNMDDPGTIVDLCHHNCGPASKYKLFCDECGKFVHEDLGTGVDDRRHGDIMHLARAISVHNLYNQVRARLPLEVPISSNEVSNFGQKLQDHRQCYSKRIISRYVIRCRRDSFGTLILMLIMQQLFSDT